MNYNRKVLVRVSWFYGGIVIAANILANLIQVVIPSPVYNSRSMEVWLQFLSGNPQLQFITSLSYIVPTALCVIYSYKNLRREEKAAKTILTIPLFYSLATAIGWGLNFLFELIALLFVRRIYGIEVGSIILTSLIYMFFSTITVFTTSYLLIDLVNRRYTLPRLFPDGHLSQIQGSHRAQFAMLFSLCFIVMTVLPVFYLLSGTINIQNENGIPVHRGLVAMSIVFVLVSLLIVISLLRLIVYPLKALTREAQNIQKGDYDSRVNIVSNDEIGVLADSFNDMASSLAEKEFMRSTFGKIVDPAVRDYLMKGNVSLGGEEREVTVLFCDIRSFTAMSERMQAESVVSLLNEYFTSLSKCITDNHGIVNKYIGDAVMAIFGAPVESANHAYDAFCAARDMRKALVLLNEHFAQTGRPSISFGIGIHSGVVLAGNIGAQNRMEYTVIGDTVNTASRIESLCKTYHTDLLVSEESVRRMGSAGEVFTLVDQPSIRGKQEKIKLFTCAS